MMQLVIIPDLIYEDFVNYRKEILRSHPYALVNDIYEKDSETAYFMFFDSRYIPTRLKEYEVYTTRV